MEGRCQWIIFSLVVFNCLVHRVLPQQCENFIQRPTNPVIIAEGGSAIVLCEHSSARNGLLWSKGSSVISPNICGCSSMSVGTDLFKLNFTNYRSTYASSYACSVPLGGPNFDICRFDVMTAVPPSVSVSEEAITLGQVGDTLNIDVTLEPGLPAANITWTRNGGPLDSRITVDNSSWDLSVTNFQPRDRGLYNITASNIAGSRTASVNVTVNFVDEVSVTSEPNGDLMCSGVAYPKPTLQWTREPSGSLPGVLTRSTAGNFDHSISSTLGLRSCPPGVTYKCTVSVSATTNIEGVVSFSCGGPPIFVISSLNVSIVGPTEVSVSWNVAPVSSDPITYEIKYTLVNSGNPPRTETITSSMATVTKTISGLMRRSTYDFSVRISPSGQFSGPVSIHIPLCNSSALSAMVSINAMLVNVGGTRTVNVSWSPLSGATRYMVSISPSINGMSSEFTTNSYYTLPSSACNGPTYVFTIRGVDELGCFGPQNSVTQVCSNAPVHSIRFSLTRRYSTGFEITILQVPNGVTSVGINATTLTPMGGRRLVSVYDFNSIPNQPTCIRNLTSQTFYNICLIVDGGGGELGVVCQQDSTISSTDDGSVTRSCRLPMVTKSVMQVIPTSGFPDWAIAVIVVGVLAVVALVFCFIGICFACNTGKSDENAYDVYGSGSSIQAPSMAPSGVVVSPRMQNHRGVSPPDTKSCLSYHRNGHSTNWNDHRDTLREMNTDTGTNV